MRWPGRLFIAVTTGAAFAVPGMMLGAMAGWLLLGGDYGSPRAQGAFAYAVGTVTATTAGLLTWDAVNCKSARRVVGIVVGCAGLAILSIVVGGMPFDGIGLFFASVALLALVGWPIVRRRWLREQKPKSQGA